MHACLFCWICKQQEDPIFYSLCDLMFSDVCNTAHGKIDMYAFFALGVVHAVYLPFMMGGVFFHFYSSYEFIVIPSNPLGEGPSTDPKPFKTESGKSFNCIN